MEFGLQALQLLGVGDRPGVQKVPVFAAALANQVDVGIGLRLLALEVGNDGLRGDDLLAQSLGTIADRRQLRDLRHRVHAVLQLGQARVVLLDVEQGHLLGRRSLHCVLPR